MVLLIIALVIISVGFLMLLGRELRRQGMIEAFNTVDRLYKQEWNRHPSDAVLAWFRVRKYIVDNYPLDANLWEAVQERIRQAKHATRYHWTIRHPDERITQVITN